MIPEQRLYQAVILQALTDAKRYAAGKLHTLPAVLDGQRADAWLRSAGRDFRLICALAGVDADSIRSAYAAGRIGRLSPRPGGV